MAALVGEGEGTGKGNGSLGGQGGGGEESSGGGRAACAGCGGGSRFDKDCFAERGAGALASPCVNWPSAWRIARSPLTQAPTSIAALLPSPREAIRSLDVSVTSATLAPGGWWVFHVSVSCAGFRYTLLRRYREFYALHTNLSAGGGKPPAFPRKYSTRSQTETFAEKRRQVLNCSFTCCRFPS